MLDSLTWDDRVDRPPYAILESIFEKADSLVSWTKKNFRKIQLQQYTDSRGQGLTRGDSNAK